MATSPSNFPCSRIDPRHNMLRPSHFQIHPGFSLSRAITTGRPSPSSRFEPTASITSPNGRLSTVYMNRTGRCMFVDTCVGTWMCACALSALGYYRLSNATNQELPGRGRHLHLTGRARSQHVADFDARFCSIPISTYLNHLRKPIYEYGRVGLCVSSC